MPLHRFISAEFADISVNEGRCAILSFFLGAAIKQCSKAKMLGVTIWAKNTPTLLIAPHCMPEQFCFYSYFVAKTTTDISRHVYLPWQCSASSQTCTAAMLTCLFQGRLSSVLSVLLNVSLVALHVCLGSLCYCPKIAGAM